MPNSLWNRKHGPQDATCPKGTGLTQIKTREIVEKLFAAIMRALVEEGRDELRNFGVFEVRRRASRKAHNPRTGERVYVPERFTVKFTAGQVIQQRVTEARVGGGPAGANLREMPVAQGGNDR